MKSLVGDVVSLKASQKTQLERLISKRVSPHEVIGLDLARKTAAIADEIGLSLGLLIERNGEIAYLVVGKKERLYLPDLGRFRLDSARLRRLRLVVFLPNAEQRLSRQQSQPILGQQASSRRSAARGGQGVIGPEVPRDLITDLEKLRLDALLVVAVLADGKPGPVAFCHLQPRGERLQAQSIAQSGRRPLVNMSFAAELQGLGIDFGEFVEELEASIVQTSVSGHKTLQDHAVLVGAYTGTAAEAQSSMAELEELARTAGIQVADKVIQRRRSVDPRTVIGKGKIEELVLHCLDLGADMLVFDRELAPGQLRSIANLTELKVIDRSMLILDIFSQRAKSSEGRLQVELAQLRYSLPRLTETDTGLSRLTGGIGGRGPGETKLEIGRRRARDRITDLEKRIDRLASQRELRRSRRQERGVPVVAIVGYTNAGKSTLLNALTKGDVFVENKLFATLDPSSRRMRFPNDREVIFVDTVGFIRELPKELVNAFRATLEEVGEADLLVHLVDASSSEMRQQIDVVAATLESLGFGDKPRILVLNKCDLLSEMEVKSILSSVDGLAVSAARRVGFEALILAVQAMLHKTFVGQDPGRFTELPG